jgi:hypothetical protein
MTSPTPHGSRPNSPSPGRCADATPSRINCRGPGAAEQVEESVLQRSSVGKSCGRLKISRTCQGIGTGRHACVNQLDEFGVQRVIDVQSASEVPAMDGSLSDTHAQ